MILMRQMIILFLLMLVGYVCRRIKILTEDSFRPLSVIVTQIANPALILSSGAENALDVSSLELVKTVGFTFLIYGLLLVAGKVILRFIRVENSKRNIYELMLMFSNIGFMGIPLVKMVFGPKEFFYITVFQIPYDILIYTYGVYLLCNVCEDNSLSVKQRIKNLVNPGSVAAIGAMIIYLSSFKLPEIVTEPLGMLGNLAAPLSMMVIGASFCNVDFKSIISDYKLVLFSLLKLIVMPMILMILIAQFGVSKEMLHVCLIVFATPVGSMVVMFAQQFGTGREIAGKCVAFTTLLSVATIPLLQVVLAGIMF
ncbi:AEC family transporter [Butyrivibrio sp. M55]|uniref:AEC family transporter n=1 Tax=Butyrivibrio sp. M55 TaxID=1855323 RepID=UPI0008E6B36A|nr:AEC family transporter [Butyrivibrio sp. M55]SFU44126.1 hypothetical protein SAMN05216540_102153 [Butyrivibrio sp. M55]